MSWNQSNCVKCGVAVYEVKIPPSRKFTAKDYEPRTVLYNVIGDWRVTLKEKNGKLQPADVQVFYKHYCLESDLNKQSVIRARHDRAMADLSKKEPTFLRDIEFSEKMEYITGAFQYKCPKCEQDIGEPCKNLAFKRGLKHTRRAHKERGFFALEQRGYKCWLDRDEKLWKIWYVGS